MVVFLVLCLFAWTIWLTLQVGGLKSRAERLERRLLDLKERHEAETSASSPEPIRQAQPQRAPDPNPFVVREIEPALGVLRPEPAAARVDPPEPSVAAPPPKPRGPPPREVVRDWLEENGLAWAGGAALALGGIFLVAYAAQRGVFTPPMRIGSAVAIGLIMLGVSEWLRRRAASDTRGHALAAALAAGAGAATIYGAAWAASSLYGLIGLGIGGGLLAAISLGLLALAFRHGQPLALLALVGGFLAPAITGVDQWTSLALTGHLGLLTVTGFAVTALRRWGPAGMTTLAGVGLWGLVGLLADGPERVAALAVGPVVLAYAGHEWRKRLDRDTAPDRRDSFHLLPPAALLAAAVLLLLLWAVGLPHALAPAGLGAIALAALSAYGVRRGLIYAPLQLAAYAVCSAAAMSGLTQGKGWAGEAWMGVLLLAVIGSGVASAVGRDGKGTRWAGGAAASALGLAIAMSGPTPLLSGAPEAVAALLLLGAAFVLARSAGEPAKAISPAIWTWTAGAAALAALNDALDPRYLPLGVALLALAVAAMHARLRWRGFAAVTLAASLAALSALVSPLMFEALEAGRLGWPLFAAIAAASAALIFAAAWITRRIHGARASAEALVTGAVVVFLAGAFLLLRPWGPGGGLDPFLESSLRTLLILVAGLTAALATPVEAEEDRSLRKNVLPAAVEELGAAIAHDQPGLIGRWRGQALLLVGLAHALVLQLMVLNPLWAWWKPAVAGPPVLDSLLVGFLAPAALLAVATMRRVSIRKPLLAIYAAGAAVLAFTWEMIEVRRLFHGPGMHAGVDLLGRAEVATYALLGLLAAGATLWAGLIAAKRPLTISPFAREVTLAGRLGAWAAVAGALLIFGFAASPWWGPIDRPLEGPLVVGFLLALYALGAAATLALWPPAARAGDPLLARAARMTTVVVAFALLNLIVRLSFRGFDMRPNLAEASLETWTFSAVWGLYGFGLLVYGAARRSNDLRLAGLAALILTLAKIFLFDMANLEGVIRAGSFLAVGALLLAAAVLVRRLGGQRPAEAPDS